jgi:hypothetical protein
MRRDGLRFLLIGGVLLATTGCSSGWEWTTWARPRVKGDGIITASEESRRESPITVGQDQVLEP